jgi:type II secretory pathway pseudopilin PulG
MKQRELSSEAGFSLIELMTVAFVILVLGGISLFYLTGHQKAYKPDDESLLVTDILQEARQRSLTERRTMRVEINLSNNTARLIDENQNPTTPDDDVVLKSVNLYNTAEVKMGPMPQNIGYNPPEPLPAPLAVFKPSVYPSSISQNVCTLRFRSDGTVVDAGNNATGTGAVMTGATIPVWSPKGTTNESTIARAITVIGSTGTIRLWEFDTNLTGTNKWKDSRRYGTYGGSATPTPTP